MLGTSSQTPTRTRAHNSTAVRFDDQLVLFDPGEGTQRQCTLAGIAIARATGVCITHFHGDHCLGLPGVIQRRSLDNAQRDQPAELPIWYPADGQQFFDRLREATIFEDNSLVTPRPVTTAGHVGTLGSLSVTAQPLDHRVTAFGYRIDEPDGRRVLPERLAELGIEGPAVRRLLADGQLDVDGRTVTADEVTEFRPGQSMAFVMDTRPCAGALELARDVDVLVCESTYAHEHADLADRYAHMTALQAGELAAEAGARRLVLTHFSARYAETEALGEQAAAVHPDVWVAADLRRIPFPERRPS